MSEEFEFEDYFSEDGDPGLTVEVEWDGRKIPFRVKRHLNLGDKQRIRAAGVKVGLDESGKARIIGEPDEAAFAKEVVLVGLKHWPFTYPDSYKIKSLAGKPVPITAETVSKLDGGLADLLATKILVATKYAPEKLDPFVMQSGAAS